MSEAEKEKKEKKTIEELRRIPSEEIEFKKAAIRAEEIERLKEAVVRAADVEKKKEEVRTQKREENSNEIPNRGETR